MSVRRLIVAGITVVFLGVGAGAARAQEDETTPPTTVAVTVETGDVAAVDDAEDDSDNTGLWGLLGLLGLAGLAGLLRRKPAYDVQTLPSTGPVAPKTSHGATGVREN